eukprot:TRINITY_DN47495_c0_g1_i1.p1 TRINITY_DN47495_c0_g1~~TRINITY_DN47495_c0_g1_i1.p1  ORF type:complete len:490 (+),score=40.21 TRINITY_DN47495_c0_g1_i1:30-1472(+)
MDTVLRHPCQTPVCSHSRAARSCSNGNPFRYGTLPSKDSWVTTACASGTISLIVGVSQVARWLQYGTTARSTRRYRIGISSAPRCAQRIVRSKSQTDADLTTVESGRKEGLHHEHVYNDEQVSLKREEDICWQHWSAIPRGVDEADLAVRLWRIRTEEDECWQVLRRFRQNQIWVELEEAKARDWQEQGQPEDDEVRGGRWYHPPPKRTLFHLTPQVGWDKAVNEMQCGACNTMKWNGCGAIPWPQDLRFGCWLLPTRDETALYMSRRKAELRAAGWKLITSAPDIIEQFVNKSNFGKLAKRLNLARHLPEHFENASDASYPCILKPAVGQYGKDTSIVHSVEDVVAVTGTPAISGDWVLQECVSGHMEYSTSMLVSHGQVLNMACMRYQYDKAEYVWPNVGEVRRELCSVPSEHLAVMQAFLAGYSGFCNFNYKIRKAGSICIFEVNARIGADLACEMPRDRARDMFQSLERLCSHDIH